MSCSILSDLTPDGDQRLNAKNFRCDSRIYVCPCHLSSRRRRSELEAVLRSASLEEFPKLNRDGTARPTVGHRGGQAFDGRRSAWTVSAEKAPPGRSW